MFRQKYLDYRELNEQLMQWAEAHPEFVRLTSIGRSAEGRDIPLLIIGHDPDEARPAVWVDGNMHATELCGSSVALAIAEDVIRLHAAGNPKPGTDPKQDEPGSVPKLPAHMAATLRQTLFYILP